jgi:TPR repeat protein
VLAQTYDPAVLGTSDARRIAADATAARDWYQKAAALGSAEARQRLGQLQN